MAMEVGARKLVIPRAVCKAAPHNVVGSVVFLASKHVSFITTAQTIALTVVPSPASNRVNFLLARFFALR